MIHLIECSDAYSDYIIEELGSQSITDYTVLMSQLLLAALALLAGSKDTVSVPVCFFASFL